jgi:hypothetical protein
MQLAGEIEIAASRRRVWDLLTDPHQVAGCVPGDPKVEVVDERNLRVTADVGNGFFRTTVTVEIELAELTAPERATAKATAAVMASPVTATGSLDLEELGPNLTRAAWTADVTLGGMLVGFAGMVQAPVQGGVDRTLECLKAKIEAEADAGAAAASEQSVAD